MHNNGIYFVFICVIHISTSANILAFMGTDLNSHLRAMSSFLEHLVPYHNITFYVTSKLSYHHQNITTINTPSNSAQHSITGVKMLDRPCEVDSYNIYYNYVLHGNISYYDEVYTEENMEKLLKSNEKYDLLIACGYGSEHYFFLAHKFNIPIIQISPSILFPWISSIAGGKTNWDSDLSFSVNDLPNSFLGRIKSYVKNVMIWHRYFTVTTPTINRGVSKYLPPETPDVETIMKRTQLVFVNTHGAMGFQRHTVPSIVEVAGMHISQPKPLPPDLEEFLSDTEEYGFIYFSLGTSLEESSLNGGIINSIMNSFRKIKRKVLWKTTSSMEVPSNVRKANWFPQQEVLRHKNIKLFITQGGMLSLTEACAFGVPVLIMPVLFDQLTNANVAENIGYGLSLSFCNFDEELFYNKVTELLTNPTYQRISKQISEVLQKDITELPSKINFWVNFVIRNPEKSILTNKIMNQTWLQTMSVDFCLGAILFIIILIALSIFTYFISKILIINLKSHIKIKVH